MKRLSGVLCARLIIAGSVALAPVAALAQVWAIGPDGRMGYIATRNPTSPNCTPPQVWTLTNGHYACQNPPPPPPPTCQAGYTETGAPTWNGSSWIGLVCTPQAPPVQQPPTIVSATGFYVWVDCTAWAMYAGTTGQVPILLYKAGWSDGSTSYYQYGGYQAGRNTVLQDSSGNYYVASVGDTWPVPALFLSDIFDPSIPTPEVPQYACLGGGRH